MTDLNEIKKTNEELRVRFDRAIETAKAAGNADAVAKLELGREFFTNEAFRFEMTENSRKQQGI